MNMEDIIIFIHIPSLCGYMDTFKNSVYLILIKYLYTVISTRVMF